MGYKVRILSKEECWQFRRMTFPAYMNRLGNNSLAVGALGKEGPMDWLCLITLRRMAVRNFYPFWLLLPTGEKEWEPNCSGTGNPSLLNQDLKTCTLSGVKQFPAHALLPGY